MKTAQVTWVGPGLRLVGKADDGPAIIVDHLMPGEERFQSGPTPMELLLIGLAGCTAMDVISILQKKRQPFKGLQVKASGERAEEHPQVYTRIHIEYIVTGDGVDPQAVERAIELSETRYCSAAAMLGAVAEITTSYRIVGDGETGDREKVEELERRVADLRARLPKHSPQAAMLVELEELEEALAQARSARAGD